LRCPICDKRTQCQRKPNHGRDVTEEKTIALAHCPMIGRMGLGHLAAALLVKFKNNPLRSSKGCCKWRIHLHKLHELADNLHDWGAKHCSPGAAPLTPLVICARMIRSFVRFAW